MEKQINQKRKKDLDKKIRYEILKLKIYANLLDLSQVLSDHSVNTEEILCKELNLSEEERSTIGNIKLVDLDLRKIGQNLSDIRVKMRELGG